MTDNKSDGFAIIENTKVVEPARSSESKVLTELQRHSGEWKQNPSEWMPWNYRETLARPGIASRRGDR